MTTKTTPFQQLAGYLLVIGLLAALHVGAMLTGLTPVLKGEMPDTDTYTRLVRIEELVKGGGWFNSTTERMNAPFGDTLNWTRPLDVMIVAGALPLHQQLGYTWRDALFWSGAILPPVLEVLFGLAMVWMVAPFFSREIRPLILLFVAAQPIVFVYSLIGRPDHQTLLLISLALALGFVGRALLRQVPALRSGLWAGLWCGFGLWVSTEFEFSFALLAGTLALMWLWQGDRRILSLLEGLGIGFLLLTLAGTLAERGGDWAIARELDKISLSQLIGAAINCGLWGMLAWLNQKDSGIARRTLTLAAMGGCALFLVILLAPELLRGPAGDIDPQVMQQFFLQIREMRPLWPTSVDVASYMLICIGVPLLGLPLWVYAYRREALSPWLPLVTLTAAFTGAALLHARFGQFAAPLGAVLLLAVMVKAAQRFEGRSLLVRVLVQALFLTAPLQLATVAMIIVPDKDEETAQCNMHQISEVLNQLPQGIVLTPLNYGPELIYFTHHDTVAGPYHRNTAGLLDFLSFFGTGDDDEAQSIIRRRGIAYVLTCPDSNATPETRAWRLSHGQIPAWLKPLELPKDQDFRLFKVDSGG